MSEPTALGSDVIAQKPGLIVMECKKVFCMRAPVENIREVQQEIQSMRVSGCVDGVRLEGILEGKETLNASK